MSTILQENDVILNDTSSEDSSINNWTLLQSQQPGFYYRMQAIERTIEWAKLMSGSVVITEELFNKKLESFYNFIKTEKL